MTPTQLKLIHIAAGQVQGGLNDAQYRTLLQNVAGVTSAKSLTNASYEDCMAVLEDLGFRQRGEPEDYWRDKVFRRGSRPGERMVFKIEAMALECRYELPALCLRMSNHRTGDVRALYPREAWQLIEAMKAIEKREASNAPA
jgi:hypothetical protein